MLPTPRTTDANGAGEHGDGGPDLRTVATLLPTPDANMGNGGRSATAEERRAGGHHVSLNEAVNGLFPTPTARLGQGRGASHPDRRKELQPKRAGELDEVATHLVSVEWGDYEAAVRRQEAVTGMTAPSPVEPNTKGKPRLSPAFAQWLMGWPNDWCTDPAIGLSRPQQLRCVGNGVVPQQALAAYRWLLSLPEMDRRTA